MKHPEDASPLIVWIFAILMFGLTFMVLSIARADDSCAVQVAELKKQIVTNDANWAQAIKTVQSREGQCIEELNAEKYVNDVLTEKYKELKEAQERKK